MAQDFSALLEQAWLPSVRAYYDTMDTWKGKIWDLSSSIRGKKVTVDINVSNIGRGNRWRGDKALTGTQALTDRSTTINEDTTPANLAWGTPSAMAADSVEFEIDKLYDIDIVVGRVLQERHFIDWRVLAAANSVREFMYEKNYFIRELFRAQTGDYSEDGPTVATQDDWGKTAHQTALVDFIGEMSVKADGWLWPPEGRKLVVGPDLYRVLYQAILDKRYFLQGAINDSALTEAELMRLFGFAIEKDIDIGVGHTNSADDVAKQTMYFCSAMPGVGYADEISDLESFRSEQYRAWRLQGIQSWGGKILIPQFQFIGTHTITA